VSRRLFRDAEAELTPQWCQQACEDEAVLPVVFRSHLIVFKELEASQLYMADIPVLLLPLLDKTDDTS